MGLFLLNFAGPVNSATTQGTITESKLLCHGPNKNYTCESGYCCESQCCSHYYELWWFWLVWTIIIILICCCVCHHRRTKHRLQQQQRQHEINLIAYREAHNYTSLPFYLRFLPSYLLPAYEEVVDRPPTPPPPYSPAQTVVTEEGCAPRQTDQPESHCPQAPASLPGPGVPSAICTPSPEPQQQLNHLPVSSLCGSGGMGDEGKLITGAPGESGQLQQHCVPAVLAEEGPPTRGGKARDCCKDLGCEPLGCPPSSPLDDKDRTPGRHRRFTGDSGIEVCVCSRGGLEDEEEEDEDEEEEDSEERMKELERLMDAGEEEEEGALRQRNFCDSCQPPSGLVHQGSRRAPTGPGDEDCGDPDGHEQARHQHPPLPPPHHHHHHHHPHHHQQEQHSQASLPRSPVCLHLHTINEQDGSHGQGTTENQS